MDNDDVYNIMYDPSNITVKSTSTVSLGRPPIVPSWTRIIKVGS